jgi:hypothetical protein
MPVFTFTTDIRKTPCGATATFTVLKDGDVFHSYIKRFRDGYACPVLSARAWLASQQESREYALIEMRGDAKEIRQYIIKQKIAAAKKAVKAWREIDDDPPLGREEMLDILLED